MSQHTELKALQCNSYNEEAGRSGKAAQNNNK
jgi:hypothetical protein